MLTLRTINVVEVQTVAPLEFGRSLSCLSIPRVAGVLVARVTTANILNFTLVASPKKVCLSTWGFQ